MQAEQLDCNAPPTRDLNKWLCRRQTDLSAMGGTLGVQTFFGSMRRY